jgi:hypothetical protein
MSTGILSSLSLLLRTSAQLALLLRPART